MNEAIRELKLARGVLFRNDEVLLVQDIRPGQGHYFLPGGSVEASESVQAALVREWSEELDWEVVPATFSGCQEHTWSYLRKNDGVKVKVFEINFLFTVTTSVENLKLEPESKESHLKFSWVSIDKLDTLNLLPSPLKTMIPQIFKDRPSGVWASTL